MCIHVLTPACFKFTFCRKCVNFKSIANIFWTEHGSWMKISPACLDISMFFFNISNIDLVLDCSFNPNMVQICPGEIVHCGYCLGWELLEEPKRFIWGGIILEKIVRGLSCLVRPYVVLLSPKASDQSTTLTEKWSKCFLMPGYGSSVSVLVRFWVTVQISSKLPNLLYVWLLQ